MKSSSVTRLIFHRPSRPASDSRRESWSAWFIAVVDAKLRTRRLMAARDVAGSGRSANLLPDAPLRSMRSSDQGSSDPGNIEAVETLAIRRVHETDRLWWEKLTRSERIR